MNAVTPKLHFDLAAQNFDAYVTQAFAATKATRHLRDRLIAQVEAGLVDHLLPRARTELANLSLEANRRAAVNVIDFHFEPIVMPSMAQEQLSVYLQAVENTLRIRDADGLAGPGPLWIDTVHHVCVFSVLFRLAAFLRRERGIGRVLLLHQGQRQEPRLGLLANLLAKAHGVALVTVPLQGRWLPRLLQLVIPDSAVFYLSDMPPAAFGAQEHKRNGRGALTLYAAPNVAVRIDTVSGSATFARKLGATHVVLDYPTPDEIRIRPFTSDTVAACPLEDWIFWPLLGSIVPSSPPSRV